MAEKDLSDDEFMLQMLDAHQRLLMILVRVVATDPAVRRRLDAEVAALREEALDRKQTDCLRLLADVLRDALGDAGSQ